MKTTALYPLVLMPVLICASAPLSLASSGTPLSSDALLQGRPAGMTVAEAPLILNDFDRSAALNAAAADANLVGGSITASLSGPERVVLPRAGGTTSVTYTVQGLSLTARSVSLPSGITVSISGGQLTLTSTANRGTTERVGSLTITAQSPANARSGRARGVLLVGVSQLPCTVATCGPAAPPAPPEPPAPEIPVPTASPAGIDWASIDSSMRSVSGA